MYFNDDQTARLNDLIGKIEKSAGIELVAAVVGKCDSYPEIPWKAFALAAAAGALAQLAASLLHPGWNVTVNARHAPLGILAIGAVFALLSVFWQSFGRLFLDRVRAETEIEQYARAFFLERELFKTRGRTGILVLVGLFERRVVIVPDSGLAGRLDPKALQGVIQQMAPHLRRKDRFQAFVQGLTALEGELLKMGFGPVQKSDNEIAEGIIQEKGEGR
jgi:putative membrane protein